MLPNLSMMLFGNAIGFSLLCSKICQFCQVVMPNFQKYFPCGCVHVILHEFVERSAMVQVHQKACNSEIKQDTLLKVENSASL